MSVLGTFVPDDLIAGDAQLLTESVLIPAGSLARGTVLGRQKVTVPTTGTLTGTGNGTCTAVTGGPNTIQGSYVVKCTVAGATHGGTFEVRNPNGVLLGYAILPDTAGGTVIFTSSEINFTLTDGTTNFIVGDYFTIAVAGVVPATASVVGTGNGTCTLIEARRDLKKGTYRVQCTVAGVTHGGTFTITDPDGFLIQTVSLPDTPGGTVDFDNDQIAGRLTDGSINFIVGDYFDIVVALHPRQCVACSKAATDGSSVPYAVLLEAVDASQGAKLAAAAIEGEFNQRALVFAAGTDVEDVRDQMRDLNMIVRMSVAA